MADYTLYYVPTPNGKKITLALEEMGLNYTLNNMSFSKKDQFSPEFLRISPNNKIPALVDHTDKDGDLAIFESGAILEYLGDKIGKFFPSTDNMRERMAVTQWLYWQVAGFGPTLGQLGFFYRWCKEDIPLAKERYLSESLRLFGVLDRQLAKHQYIAGEDYSIADMATYWWSTFPVSAEEISDQFKVFENVKRWQDEIAERDAVKRTLEIPFNV